MTLEDRTPVRMPHQDREGQAEAARGLDPRALVHISAGIRAVLASARVGRVRGVSGEAQRCVISWASV
eukprot:7367102-Prymnesium_polylepis.1